MPIPKASICLSTFNKPHLLKSTLESIYRQKPPFLFETIVVDDGSADSQVRDICHDFPVRYHRIDREPVFRNPCQARNVAYKLARADVIIAQSDEVLHVSEDAIERLTLDLEPGTMRFAHVFCLSQEGKVDGVYTGPTRKAPYFFLGSMWREDLYAVGGNDEQFLVSPAWEDQWFADCMIRGRGLTPVFATNVVGHHQWHVYCSRPETEGPSRDLYRRKLNASLLGGAPWVASGGPWPMIEFATRDVTKPVTTAQVEAKFTEIYHHKSWGPDQESRSGAGSSLKATERAREALPLLMASRGMKSLLDIPCGDFNWMRETRIGWVDYTGGDIVGELIDELQSRYGNERRRFLKLDLLSSELPQADLVLCRDCLQHLSHVDFQRAIANIVRSGAKWLLATTFPGRLPTDNRPIETGQWWPHNLEAEPFNFPPPVELINEDCQEWYPYFADKSLGLWIVADLVDKPKSLTVCVDYDDFLTVTLPRNKRHFSRTLVVTSPTDTQTQELAKEQECECYVTDAFYRDGAVFNKGLAVEEAFDVLGRDGWICVWDADVVMPESIDIQNREQDCLYVPGRHILDQPGRFSDDLNWATLPLPTQPHEFDGYCQIFHASAIDPPWYGTTWTHAGGCDSDFEFKFPAEKRRRAPFTVLHLGTDGSNWRGRVTPRIDTGEIPAAAEDRTQQMRQMLADRKTYGTAREHVAPQPAVDAIPRCMSFFWSGRLSWIRYLTLETFRRWNPDWQMRLYVPDVTLGSRQWRTPERDDTGYHGTGYGGCLKALGIEAVSYLPPVDGVAPAQASDLAAWSVLATEGGWYADMDILWLGPMDGVAAKVAQADAVFCLESGMLAVGLLAGRPRCEIFQTILRTAVASPRIDQYQNFGTDAAYRTFRPPGRSRETIGTRTVAEIRRRYRQLRVDVLPDVTVYPWDWRQIDEIFERDNPPPAGAVGIHWFGGSAVAQEWIRRLVPDNWQQFSNTFTACLRQLGY